MITALVPMTDEMDATMTQPPPLDEDKPCEAGIFALSSGGWTLVQRRKYPNMAAAYRWIKARADTLALRHSELRFRASAVTLDGWLTLDEVLADYEAKRKAGVPEFSRFP